MFNARVFIGVAFPQQVRKTASRAASRSHSVHHQGHASLPIFDHDDFLDDDFLSDVQRAQHEQQAHHDLLSGRVLVLNQSYEPISICNVQKAIVLLVLTKAELVAGLENRAVRSVRESFAFPSVIRLRRYIHAPIKKIELSRKNILRRDGNRCQYCGTTRAPLTVDHVMPRSRGGGDSWENLVCACVKCNIRKGNRTPDEAGMKLAKTPRRPTHVTFIRNINGDVDEHWKPYLFI